MAERCTRASNTGGEVGSETLPGDDATNRERTFGPLFLGRDARAPTDLSLAGKTSNVFPVFLKIQHQEP
jgi:hypothetical protein